MKANHAAGRLRFTSDAAAAIAHGEITFIAVGTPADQDGSADLQYVLAVARTVGRHIDGPAIVVNKSTVPVGTADIVRVAIQEELAARGVAHEVDVVSNPEFLKEGDAVADCMRPDRIVIGAKKPAAIARMRRLYAPFNRNRDRIVEMDVRSAELTKYAANAMLATKISFMNEIATIAERVGADVEHVRNGIGSDPRIGWHFIYPGAGYGGSCFPKDAGIGRRQPSSTACGRPCSRQWKASITRKRAICSNWCSGITVPRAPAVWPARPSRCGVWRSSPIPTTCVLRPAVA